MIKNTKLGGTDWESPSRIKPVDLNDTFDEVADRIETTTTSKDKIVGQLFKNQLQTICNADLIGINAKMNLAGGNLNLKNTYFNSGKTDTATTKYGMIHDSTDKLWKTLDYYVVVEATSLSSAISNVNNCYSYEAGVGIWIIYCSTGTKEVRRAQIIKTLFYGTNGTDAKILNFTGITAIKTSHSNDVGKRVHYAKISFKETSNVIYTYTGTFSDTTNNTNCSSWSKVSCIMDGATVYSQWEIASGNIRNSVTSSSYEGVVSSDEFGVDTSGDEIDNPANCQLEYKERYASNNSAESIILCVGDIEWVSNGGDGTNGTNVDFYTDHSIPVFTEADALVSYLIFKSTPTENVTNAIMCANYSIDPTSSIQYSMSTDGTNWVNCNDSEICDLTSGSDIYRKITITRTDLSKLDKVSQEGVFYNVR